MAISQDKLQDVFPVNFDFVKGEQPSATKLTGWVKQTDTAFSKMTTAIGDPWDYNIHSGSGGAYVLSPTKLGQTSIARFAGPSDYASPRGASFQEGITSTIVLHLSPYYNQWCVGFPLVYLSSAIDPSDSLSGKIHNMTWGSHITLASPSTSFVTEKISRDDLETIGDFHIDYRAGVITTYARTTAQINLNITTMNMFGPGVPWGTSNVIPHWNQTASLCYVTLLVTAGGMSTYRIDFPKVESAVRDTVDASMSDGPASWTVHVSGESAYYRMPYQLTSNLLTNDNIPEGAIFIYDNDQGRILPITDIRYNDEHSILCRAPTGWLTEGETVRVFVTGSSLAENVHYLMTTTRESRHVGLSSGQKSDTVQYSVPISHNDLTDAYAGYISSSFDSELFSYRESTFPVNPHPQYLHRSGYQESDLEGNHANAMRGDIVFAGVDDFALGGGALGGQITETYGLTWGGHQLTGSYSNTRLAYQGGYNLNNWEEGNGPAFRFGFGLESVCANTGGMGALTYTPWSGTPFYIRGYNGDNEGSGGVIGFDLGRESEMNYIKLMPSIRTGTYDTFNMPVRKDQTIGTVLSITTGLSRWDWKRLSASQIREFRFRSVSRNPNALNGDQSIGAAESPLDQSFTFDVSSKTYGAPGIGKINIPDVSPAMFKIGSTLTLSGFTSDNGDHVISSVSTATEGAITYTVIKCNETIASSETVLGATATIDGNEFNQYFVSPGMVGCDFLNLYSNAIFFSDTGDGKATSFTTLGEDWMNDGSDAPSGIYFIPEGASSEPYLAFAAYDTNLSETTTPFSVGDRHGLYYASANGGDVFIATAGTDGSPAVPGGFYLGHYHEDGLIHLFQGLTAAAASLAADVAGQNSLLTDSDLYVSSGKNTWIQAASNLLLESLVSLDVQANTIDIESSSDMNISSNADLDIYGDTYVAIRTISSIPVGVGMGGMYDIGLLSDSSIVEWAKTAIHMRSSDAYPATSGTAWSYMTINRSDIDIYTKETTGNYAQITMNNGKITLNTTSSAVCGVFIPNLLQSSTAGLKKVWWDPVTGRLTHE